MRLLRLGSVFVALAAAVSVGAGSASAAPINLVTNGGFETGDLSGWTLAGNTGFTGVQCPGPSSAVFEGNCSAFMGPVGSDGSLSQTLSTTVGQVYFISFAFAPDGGTPGDFSMSFGGTTLFSVSNPPASAYQVHTFLRAATSTSSTLTFSFRDDPGFDFLDGVSVTAVPEPATLSLLGLGLAAGYRRMKRAREIA